jgi:hypothetical protein
VNLNSTYQLRRVQDAERALERDLRNVDGIMASARPYSPEAEAAERQRIQKVHDAEVGTVQQLYFDEIKSLEQQQEALSAQIVNPRIAWPGDQVAALNAHFTACERDLRTYPFSELAAQMRAALAVDNAPLLLAWRDALVGRQAEASGEQANELATWVDTFNAKLRARDPSAVRKVQDMGRQIDELRDGLRDIHGVIRPRQVARLKAEMAASGAYSF